MKKLVIASLLTVIFIAGCSTSSNDSQINTSTSGMEFVLVPAGTFMMGSDSGESDEKPVHQVTISEPFFIQTTEVTQGQWKAVMGSNPSWYNKCGDNCPVEMVSWYDVREFIQMLNAEKGWSKYRLPTEAEWEYAARSAGKDETYSGGNDIDAVAWYGGKYEVGTHSVGQKKPNGLGIYDMSGNVMEWCSDWYGSYPSESVIDPQGPSSGSDRVIRGGGWPYDAWSCRAAARYRSEHETIHLTLGFRLAFSVQ